MTYFALQEDQVAISCITDLIVCNQLLISAWLQEGDPSAHIAVIFQNKQINTHQMRARFVIKNSSYYCKFLEFEHLHQQFPFSSCHG